MSSGCACRKEVGSSSTHGFVRPGSVFAGPHCTRPAAFPIGISARATAELTGPTTPITDGSSTSACRFAAPRSTLLTPFTASSSASMSTVMPVEPAAAFASAIARRTPLRMGSPSRDSPPDSGRSTPRCTTGVDADGRAAVARRGRGARDPGGAGGEREECERGRGGHGPTTPVGATSRDVRHARTACASSRHVVRQRPRRTGAKHKRQTEHRRTGYRARSGRREHDAAMTTRSVRIGWGHVGGLDVAQPIDRPDR